MDYYPNPATKCFYNILKRAKIAVDEDVQLLLTYPSGDAIPCIGMVDMPHGTVEKYFGYNKTVLPVDHPAYDPEHPDAEYITERVLHKTSPGAISLHIFANSKAQKDSMVYQINRAIDMVIMGQFEQCGNFEDGICKTTGETCDATTVINAYSYSGMCPYVNITDPIDPLFRNPTDSFAENGLRAVEVQLPSSLDELGVIPEVFHSSILITYLLDEEYVTPVALYCEYKDTEDDTIEY